MLILNACMRAARLDSLCQCWSPFLFSPEIVPSSSAFLSPKYFKFQDRAKTEKRKEKKKTSRTSDAHLETAAGPSPVTRPYRRTCSWECAKPHMLKPLTEQNQRYQQCNASNITLYWTAAQTEAPSPARTDQQDGQPKNSRVLREEFEVDWSGGPPPPPSL